MTSKHTGKTFGKWTVIGKGTPYYRKGMLNYYRLECKCECGFIQHIPYNKLQRGSTKSCKGCFKKTQTNRRYYTIQERLFKQRVVQSGIDFTITASEYYEIAKNNCYYCGALPQKYSPYKNDEKNVLFVNGVDRINSDIGYEIDNCLPCCYGCNTAKNDQTQAEFFDRIERIYNIHLKGKK